MQRIKPDKLVVLVKVAQHLLHEVCFDAFVTKRLRSSRTISYHIYDKMCFRATWFIMKGCGFKEVYDSCKCQADFKWQQEM